MNARVGIVVLLLFLTSSVAVAEDADVEARFAAIAKRLELASVDERRQAELDLIELAREVGESLRPLVKDWAGRASDPAKSALLRQLAWLNAPELARWWDILLLIDVLDLPGIEGKSFVIYNTGGRTVWGTGDAMTFEYELGWILEESEHAITLLTTALGVKHHSKRQGLPKDWAKFEAAHPAARPLPGKWMARPFREYCRKFLETGARDYHDTGPDRILDGLEHVAAGGLDHPIEAVLFAHWALVRGETETAKSLLELADRSADIWNQRHRGASLDIRSIVRGALATNLRWQAIRAANAGEDRARLFGRWQRLRCLLAGADPQPEADEMLALYRRMVEEDAAWTEPTEKERAEMSHADLAAYWVHQLRDLAARQLSQPGGCSVFGFSSGMSDETVSCHAAWQLFQMGPAAVPLLIDHLDDPRPTRSMGFHRDFFPASFYLLRTGDACQEILSRIAGRSFFVRRTTNSYMRKDGKTAAVQKAARAWWAEYREKGEERILADGVATGRRDSPAQARILMEKYPDAALDALKVGIRAAGDSWVRNALVEILSGIEGDGPVPLLIEEMREGPSLANRVTAATVLRARGLDTAVPAMIAEWRATSKIAPPGPGMIMLINFLLASRDPAAARALADGWEVRSLSTRYLVVAQCYYLPSLVSGEYPLPPECMSAIENLLVEALKDEAPRTGLSCTWGDVGFTDPRVCDVAGFLLSQTFGDRYRFDIEAPLGARNRARRVLKNTWRKAHDLPPLPPPGPKVKPLKDIDLDRYLLSLLGAEEEASRRVLAASIRKLGLPALPAVKAALKDLPEDHAARPALMRLARELSLVVRVVEIDDRSLPVDERLRTSLDTLVGCEFDSGYFVELLSLWWEINPGPQVWFRLEAHRDGDDSGVVLRLTLEPPQEHETPRPGQYRSTRSVMIGNRRILGGTLTRQWIGAGAFKTLADHIDRALASAPSEPIRIVVTLRCRRE
jgi:hypothetical protein